MRVLIQHRSSYRYPTPASLGPHVLRLRPTPHARANVESYALRIEPEHQLRWQQDPYGNHVAHVMFPPEERVDSLDVLVELAIELHPVNPFDFFLDDLAEQAPFAYPDALAAELAPFMGNDGPAYATGERFEAFAADLPAAARTVDLIVELNRRVAERVEYVIREEPGIWTPEETLANGRGSCRDSATLLVAILRTRGFAARFASGYLVQLADEGMIPDQPKGVDRDVVDLHAWAEVYLPGAGWVGLDATSGLLAGEGHIPLACTASPVLAAPLDGTSDVRAEDVDFSTLVGRLGHESRPTAPYTEEVWQALLDAGDRVDATLQAAGLSLTLGGEPTFNSRDHAEAPEWNSDALGPTKWVQGQQLARELVERLAPGAAVLHRMGKQYPGESLPRWAIDICARRDGPAPWPDRQGLAARGDVDAARAVAEDLATRLGVSDGVQPAFEDPWRLLQDEASLPVDVDPLDADLDDPEERRRLARILDRGPATAAGFVLPLTRQASRWVTDRWELRRGRLYLVPGDSPMGLRLPLPSLGAGLPTPRWLEEAYPPDPRVAEPTAEERQLERHVAAPTPSQLVRGVRTALCVEPRGEAVHVFLPPMASADDFFALIEAIDATRAELSLDVRLEGYPPPPDPGLFRFSVTPDPGVLEVNVPPTDSVRGYAELVETVFDAAQHAGLHAEKYLLDGRQQGSGGGNHVTVGGPTPLSSPMLQRPDVLASLVTFLQHHPSLSYLFTGLFVGPTSQAPRVDEARTDAIYELEIALERAFAARDEPAPPPWLADILLRHLLVDVSGSTHRAEICLDKLFDPQTPYGRQGLVELRAFEMPPHPRMATAQTALVRALIAAFAKEPYQAPLVRWGQALHDRFLLPHFMWQDFEQVLQFLDDRGVGLPHDAYTPFLDLRCPTVGRIQAGEVVLEVRNAIEPWHVLGEEVTTTGTSRFVDSSMERVEVRAWGLVPERHGVTVNGRQLPMRATPSADLHVAGVRFRAWAPPHSLHPHLGIHHPLRFDVVDTWARRSLGACAYHVWHPEGRAYDTPPLTRFEAAARRAQRFTHEGPAPWPVEPAPARPHPDAPYTLDLRRFPMDRPMPEPTEEP